MEMPNRGHRVGCIDSERLPIPSETWDYIAMVNWHGASNQTRMSHFPNTLLANDTGPAASGATAR